MSYYGARVTRTKEDMEGNKVDEEEDIFVEMRHAIQVRAPLVCHDGTSAYEPIFLRECLRCLVLSV